uniref:ATPase inhibitor n=1 Tax=Fagus sylvatica TaxID=28930 RepID=A0A2N9IAB5_FAGSY
MAMRMRSVLSRVSVSLTRPMDSTRGATRYFSDDKGRVLSEEERAAETVYIQKMEREKLEKQRKKADKEKAEKEKADKVSCSGDGGGLWGGACGLWVGRIGRGVRCGFQIGGSKATGLIWAYGGWRGVCADWLCYGGCWGPLVMGGWVFGVLSYGVAMGSILAVVKGLGVVKV